MTRIEKIDSGLHPVFRTKNLKASAPGSSYEGKFVDIPDSAIAEMEYEITKIMAHLLTVAPYFVSSKV
jgi:hypothetical protein